MLSTCKRLIFILLAPVVLVVVGCEKSDEKQEVSTSAVIEITGEVGQGFHPAQISQSTYMVSYTIKNLNKAPLEFDVVHEIWLAGTREGGLPMRHIPRDGVTLLTGQTKQFQSDTDGYTMEILERAQGGPVQFAIALRLKGNPVAGPFVTSLPELSKLPMYYEKTVKGTALSRLTFQEVDMSQLDRNETIYDGSMNKWRVNRVKVRSAGAATPAAIRGPPCSIFLPSRVPVN